MIITFNTGKTPDDIHKQCRTCQFYDNKLYYCTSPLKSQKVRYKNYKSNCKSRKGKEGANDV